MGPDGHGVWESPCSGFVTHDAVTGQVCAGFRQCHGTGVKWAAPNAVPLELRCASDQTFTNWSAPQFIDALNPNFLRHEPYDPVRPWVDSDGRWYLAMSFDACNSTQVRPPQTLLETTKRKPQIIRFAYSRPRPLQL